jgi:hypothetical protein
LAEEEVPSAMELVKVYARAATVDAERMTV